MPKHPPIPLILFFRHVNDTNLCGRLVTTQVSVLNQSGFVHGSVSDAGQYGTVSVEEVPITHMVQLEVLFCQQVNRVGRRVLVSYKGDSIVIYAFCYITPLICRIPVVFYCFFNVSE